MIGFLILLPFIDFYQDVPNLMIIFGTLCCWIIGLLLWSIFDLWLFPKLGHKTWLSNNNIVWINREYRRISGNLEKQSDPNSIEPKIHLNRYYQFYYAVSDEVKLGPVPALESFSAFFRNLVVVLSIWIILICLSTTNSFIFHFGPLIIVTCGKCSGYISGIITPFLSILMCSLGIILCLLFRMKTERKIYAYIVETYLTYLINNDKDKLQT